MKISFEWRTIKASKRYNTRNPISAAFEALTHAVEESEHELTTVDEADVVFTFGSITPRKSDTERARVIAELKKTDKHILSLDSGLFGTYIRQTMKSPESGFFRIHHDDCTGEGRRIFNGCSSERLDWFTKSFKFDVKPMKKNDGKILFIGQSEKGWQYDLTTPYADWAAEQISILRGKTDRPILFKVHPTDVTQIQKRLKKFKDVEIVNSNRSRMSIVDDMQKCTTSITHSSSAALESIVEGLNTIALSPRCVAWDGCMHTYVEPMPEGRQQFLQDIAYNTWHISEMVNPKLLEVMIDKIKSI